MSELTGMLSPPPNWEFFWQLHKKKQETDEWEKDGKTYRQKCFGVYAFATLSGFDKSKKEIIDEDNVIASK